MEVTCSVKTIHIVNFTHLHVEKIFIFTLEEGCACSCEDKFDFCKQKSLDCSENYIQRNCAKYCGYCSGK